MHLQTENFSSRKGNSLISNNIRSGRPKAQSANWPITQLTMSSYDVTTLNWLTWNDVTGEEGEDVVHSLQVVRHHGPTHVTLRWRPICPLEVILRVTVCCSGSRDVLREVKHGRGYEQRQQPHESHAHFHSLLVADNKNKTGTSKVGAISKAQKAQKTF